MTVYFDSRSEVHELADAKGSSKNEAKTALIHDSAVAKDDSVTARQRGPLSKWKTTVCIGATLATLVLSTNVALLAWVTRSFEQDDGIATIFEGKATTLHEFELLQLLTMVAIPQALAL